MNPDRLVRMANQISQFFEAEPRREDGVAGVLDHIQRFWEPRMRHALAEHAARGGAGLRDLAREAAGRLGGGA